MKYTIDQIKLLDKKILPLFGIKSIDDYKSEINVTKINKITKLTDEMNKLLPEIRKIFPVKKFNFHKTFSNIYKICLKTVK